MEPFLQRQSFKHGLITLGVLFVLLLTVAFIPIISLIIYFFLPFPIVLYQYKHGFKRSMIVGSVLVLFSLFIYLPLFFIALPTVAAGLVMGYFYRQKKSALMPIMTGILVYIIYFMLVFAFLVGVAGVNIYESISQYFSEMAEENPVLANLLLVDDATLANYLEMIDSIIMAMPAFFIIFSAAITGLHHVIQRRLLSLRGHEVLSLPPLKDWTFPKSILWYYLATLLLILIGLEPNNDFYPILINLHFILEVIIYLQGLALIAYFSESKKMGKLLPIITIVLTILLFNLMLILVRILGIFEMGFKLRERIKKQDSSAQ
jgi:uncharacterized protein YybS (DUF2232 family)